MEKTIKVGGKEIVFKTSAATPRYYRMRFGRDLLVDYQMLLEEASRENALSTESLTNFENFAYIMAKQADPGIPDTPDAWLDGFDMFSIYDILPQLVDLWSQSNVSTSISKKKV